MSPNQTKRLGIGALTPVISLFLMGQSSGSCAPVTQFETTDGTYSLASQSDDKVAVSGQATGYRSSRHTRFEIWGAPMTERLFESALQDEGAPGWWADLGWGVLENGFSNIPHGSSEVMTPLDEELLPYGTDAHYVMTYYEGVASITLPWDIANLHAPDPTVNAALRAALGDGLRPLILDAWDEGLAGAGGERIEDDVFWIWDGVANFRADPNRKSHFFLSPRPRFARHVRENQIGLRSYFLVNTHISFSGSPRENLTALIPLFQPLVKLFGIGDCRTDTRGSINVLGHFEVTTSDELYYPVGYTDPGGDWVFGESTVTPSPGKPKFVIDDVQVVVGEWENRPICNKNRYKIEEGIEEAVLLTAEASFASATALADLLPFELERCTITGEGVTCVIAEDYNDPDWALAKSLRLHEQDRPPVYGGLWNTGWQP